MSLEDKIAENTAVMKELVKALQGKAGAAPAGATAGAKPGAKPVTGKAKPKNTAEMVMAAAVKVKKELSVEAAKYLIQKHGADELKALKPEVYDDFVADCEAAIESGAVEGMDDDGGSDL